LRLTAVLQRVIRSPATLYPSPAFEGSNDGWRRLLRQQLKTCLQSDWLRPLSRGLATLFRGQATSLLYHRILPGPVLAMPSGAFVPHLCLCVAAGRFDEQMDELQRRGGSMALPQAVAALKAGQLPPGTVTVTFDDGYRDNLKLALPILERYGIPATIFITTGLVDRSAVLWWEELEALVRGSPRLAFEWQGQAHDFELDEAAAQWRAFNTIVGLFRPLTPKAQAQLLVRLRASSNVSFSYDREILNWEELRELDRHPLITIAAHTVNHPVLTQVDSAALRSEIGQSRLRLEQQLRPSGALLRLSVWRSERGRCPRNGDLRRTGFRVRADHPHRPLASRSPRPSLRAAAHHDRVLRHARRLPLQAQRARSPAAPEGSPFRDGVSANTSCFSQCRARAGQSLPDAA
jgi:peptidoglycan/xylan/chitin deacetylase (PgdA/CDA1 family)